MANYTKTELLNEVSKIFRAGLSPGKSGGTLNTSTEYRQLLELVSVTLLLKPDSVFYIARLAANRLNTTLSQEIAVLEDILVALDDLGQVGTPVRNTASLANARTAALSLDAARSVTNRPEAQRFSRQIDNFASQVRKNLVSTERGGAFARPREEARWLIQKNLTTLSSLHSRLLDQIFSLYGLLEDFLSLDLPSKISGSVLGSVSNRLITAIEQIQSMSDAENLAASRKMLLSALANKMAVQTLTSFKDPTEFKYRSPNRPIPSTAKHWGRVVGVGDPASVLTSSGPWDLPISAPLELSVSEGATVSIDLSETGGALLSCRNNEPYVFSDDSQLAVIVDPEGGQGEVVDSLLESHAEVTGLKQLGFKHLGAAVSFVDAVESAGFVVEDLYPRYITELTLLQTALAASVSFADPILTISATNPGIEPAVGLLSGHVGGYVVDSSGNKFEITRVLSSTQCVINTRGIVADFSAGLELRGPRGDGSAGAQSIDFQPPLSALPEGTIVLSPAVKTATILAGSYTAAEIVANIQLELGTYGPSQDGEKLNWHVSAELMAGDPTRVVLRARSAWDPYVQITGRFLAVQNPAALGVLTSTDAHSILGLLEGEIDSGHRLTAAELAAIIGSQAGLEAEVVVDGESQRVQISITDSGPGTSLTVVSSPAEFGLTSSITYSTLYSFEAVDKLGNKLKFGEAVPGDFLRVVGRQEARIVEVGPTELVLETGLPSNITHVAFEVRSAAARSFNELNELLRTYTTSPNLLKKHRLNQGVAAINNACTTATLLGRNFQASRNQAKRLVADLISILTNAPSREGEYTTTIPIAAANLRQILAAYEAPVVEDVNRLIEAFLDRKYDRAADFLRSGRFTQLYQTNDETGSFSGAVTDAARRAIRDLPTAARTREALLAEGAYAQSTQELPEEAGDFTEYEPEDYGL